MSLVRVVAGSVSLVPVADTTLFQPDPDHNLGAVDSLAVGGTATGALARSLIRFDLTSQVPSGARIVSVRLSFHVVKIPTSGGVPSDFELRRLLKPWNEGSKAGGPRGTAAEAGETTWNSIAHGSIRWSQPGAGSGLDFASAPSGSVRVSGFGAYTFDSSPSLVSEVQAWTGNPANNHGWMMISRSERTPETARRIGAREAGAMASILTVEFVDEAVAAPLKIERIERVGDQFQVGFQTRSNHSYSLEFQQNTGSGSWLPFAQFPSLPYSTNRLVIGPAQDGQRFFRLREEQASTAR